MKEQDIDEYLLKHQQNVVEKALLELRSFAGLSFDQSIVVKNYLHMVYQIGYLASKKLNHRNRAVQKIKNGEVLDTYISIAEAARCNPGIHAKTISRVLTGRANSSGGYFWKYAE